MKRSLHSISLAGSLAGLALAIAGCTGGVSAPDSPPAPAKPAQTGQPMAHRSAVASGRVGGNVGDTAYDFDLVDASGNNVHLSDFKGKVVILDFWATWCGPCRNEIPGFVAIHKQYQSRGVEVVGVSLDDDWDPVLPFMQSYNINYTIVLGDDDVTGRYGNIQSIPTTFVIDKDGVIRSKHVGFGSADVFTAAVDPLL